MAHAGLLGPDQMKGKPARTPLLLVFFPTVPADSHLFTRSIQTARIREEFEVPLFICLPCAATAPDESLPPPAGHRPFSPPLGRPAATGAAGGNTARIGICNDP